MVCYRANVQAPLFCYKQEAAMRLQVTMDSIQAERTSMAKMQCRLLLG